MIDFGAAISRLLEKGYPEWNVEEKLAQDMLYLSGIVDTGKIRDLVKVYVFDDERMLERDMAAVVRRVSRTFGDARYMQRLAHRRANWLEIDPREATERLLEFLGTL